MRIALIAFLACCGVAMAGPERLVFDKNVRNRTNASPIKKVHLEIPTWLVLALFFVAGNAPANEFKP